MKKIICLIMSIVLAFSLSACSSEEINTAKSDDLKSQYSFYEKSVKEIIKEMKVTQEQADEIFIVLVNNCGLTGAIRSIYTTNNGATYSYYWEGSAKTQEITIENGVVSQVRYLSEILYPIVNEVNSNNSFVEQDSVFNIIINSTDLPKYYGSLKEAKEFSKRFDKNIVSTEDYDFKSDITILSFDGYWVDDKISGVEFYFKNADVSLNFQEAEAVMNLFLPLDTLEENYSEPKYEIFTPSDKSKSEYIAVTYLYKQDNSDASENGLHNNFYIMYELYNDVCFSANVDSRLPRWTSSANANGYTIMKYPPAESTSSNDTVPTESSDTSQSEITSPSAPESSSDTISQTQTSSTTVSTPQYKPNTVYIAASGNGTKYHKSKNCSQMNGNVIEMTREQAEAAGYTACKKNSCYG